MELGRGRGQAGGHGDSGPFAECLFQAGLSWAVAVPPFLPSRLSVRWGQPVTVYKERNWGSGAISHCTKFHGRCTWGWNPGPHGFALGLTGVG